MQQPLKGQVALVAGATRGAGRGIAIELAAAGAKVYCTGRSTRGNVATAGRTETIDETADIIAAAGGTAVAVRVDHTVTSEVEALAARVRADDGRLDVLVNDIWGVDEKIAWDQKFWQLDIATVRAVMEQAMMSHLVTSRYLAPMMVEAKRGLIVEVTDGEMPGYRGQLLYDLAKSSVNRLAYEMAWDLLGTGVTALAVSPGFLRSEAMLDHFGVTEANWRDGAKKDPAFVHSETPRYTGRAIAALAADGAVGAKAGMALFTDDLAETYGFTDVDGSRPHFWKSIERWIDGEIAKPLIADGARFIAQTRYGHIHLLPSRAEQARRYRDALGLTGLGEGLQPIGS